MKLNSEVQPKKKKRKERKASNKDSKGAENALQGPFTGTLRFRDYGKSKG